mmetsp:Transcript_9571/g.23022  ORF Transcript_9571/g.23022 Transcript_9571/m.23022 type:complete len:257 (-) Transcript_9571:385-1155(-)
MLGARAPNEGIFQLLQNSLVYPVTEILYGVAILRQDHRVVVVWEFTLGLGVDAQEAKVVPDHLDEAIEVPVQVRADGAVVRELVDDVELLERDLVDLVDGVDARDVHSGALDHVHHVVNATVALEMDVGVVDAVLGADGLDRFEVELWVGDARGQGDAPLVLLLEGQRRGLLVQPDAEPLELVLDEPLVGDGLEAVEHDDDEVARPRRGDDLPPAALPVLGALDDPRQVQQLDLRASVSDDARDARQRRELVARHL